MPSLPKTLRDRRVNLMPTTWRFSRLARAKRDYVANIAKHFGLTPAGYKGKLCYIVIKDFLNKIK